MGNNSTLLLSAALFILAVSGSNWFSLRQLTKVLEDNKNELKAELRGEIGSVRAEIQRIDQRIDNMEKRLDRIERQLDQVFKPIGTLGS